MKPALIRSVDAQGRIILPVEIRRTMGISSGDILEIRPSDQGIYLSKYKANVSGKRQIKKYLNLLYSATGCSMAICNCDEVLVSKGIFLREGTAIAKDLSDIICTGKEMQIAEKLPAVESEKVFCGYRTPACTSYGPVCTDFIPKQRCSRHRARTNLCEDDFLAHQYFRIIGLILGGKILMRKIQPLTPEEQLYAEKHHEMLYHFLSHYQLDETEYFDVVVFGYLAAIQEYLRKPHLQCYCFSTIAWKNMYEAFLQELTYKNRSKRKAPLLSLQEDLALEELNQFLPNRLDALTEQLNDREIALELLSYLTPKEQEVVMLKADGYTYTEIAKLCRITTHGVRSRVSRFRNRLVTTICLPHGGERA